MTLEPCFLSLSLNFRRHGDAAARTWSRPSTSSPERSETMSLTTMPRPATRARDKTEATMKAFVYRGPGKKALGARPRPEIAATRDAIAKVGKTTIRCSDLQIRKGDVRHCQPGRIRSHEGVAGVDKVGCG